jgi:hypothetical protein
VSETDFIPHVGVPMFCETCRRQLVSFNGDGTFNLAGRVRVWTMGEGTIDDDGMVEPPSEMVVISAMCFRRRCVAERFIANLRRKIRWLSRR